MEIKVNAKFTSQDYQYAVGKLNLNFDLVDQNFIIKPSVYQVKLFANKEDAESFVCREKAESKKYNEEEIFVLMKVEEWV